MLRHVAAALVACALMLGTVPGTAAGAADQRISGGRDVVADWMVHVSLADNTTCGGMLVAPTWVLTAGHCVSGAGAAPTPGRGVSLTFGRSDRTRTADGVVLAPERIVVHPQFDQARLRGDAALLELAAPVPYPTVRIANASEEGLWAEGSTGAVLGWGATPGGDGGPSEHLKQTAMQRVASEKCLPKGSSVSIGAITVGPPTSTYEYDEAFHFCADGHRPGQGGSCSGDSGGPFAVTTPRGALRVAGLVSYGPTGCVDDPTDFTVFTRIAGAELLSWVAEVAPEAIAPIEPPLPAPAPPPVAPAPTAAPTATAPAAKSAPVAKVKPRPARRSRRVCKRVKRRGRPAKRVCRVVRRKAVKPAGRR